MANKERLIDANALLAGICKDCGNGCDLVDNYCLLATEIMKAPTVDAVEVVHASWENGFCTNCKYPAEVASIGFNCTGGTRVNYKHTRFCPGCGAKMDGGVIMPDTKRKLIELLKSAYGTSFNAPHLAEHELEPLADHLIANGVTLQKVITVEGYKMFTGTMRICWQHPECPPQEIYGDWLYRPDTGYWYCNGKSYLADNCTIVEKP